MNYKQINENDTVRFNGGAYEHLVNQYPSFPELPNSGADMNFGVLEPRKEGFVSINILGEIWDIDPRILNKVIESVDVITEFVDDVPRFNKIEFPSKDFKDAYVIAERNHCNSAYSDYLSATIPSERRALKLKLNQKRLSFAVSKGFKLFKRATYRIMDVKKELA